MSRARPSLLRGLRLLPVLLIAASLMLTVRIGDLATGIEIGGTTRALAESAETEEPSKDKSVAEKTPSEQRASDAAEDEFNIISEFTEAELELLQDLSKRREELAAREQELESRSRLLDAAESRLETQIAELQDLRKSIEGLVREYDEQEQSELESVVKIYETMKPKDAARILGELEMETLLGIMDRMKERKTAPILAAMEPKRAREVTAELARQRAVDLSTASASGS